MKKIDYEVLDFTASGRASFERFYAKSAKPERRGELVQALDECLSRLEEQLNEERGLAWTLPPYYARAGDEPFVFLSTPADLVVERAGPDSNAPVPYPVASPALMTRLMQDKWYAALADIRADRLDHQRVEGPHSRF